MDGSLSMTGMGWQGFVTDWQVAIGSPVDFSTGDFFYLAGSALEQVACCRNFDSAHRASEL